MAERKRWQASVATAATQLRDLYTALQAQDVTRDGDQWLVATRDPDVKMTARSLTDALDTLVRVTYDEALRDAAAACRSRSASLFGSQQYLAANEAEKCAAAIERVAAAQPRKG